MTINNEQGNFQEGARVPEKDILGRTWGVNRNSVAADQGEAGEAAGSAEAEVQKWGEVAGEALAAPVEAGATVLSGAAGVVGELMQPPGKEAADSAVSSLPMSVSASDILAASKKYGSWGSK